MIDNTSWMAPQDSDPSKECSRVVRKVRRGNVFRVYFCIDLCVSHGLESYAKSLCFVLHPRKSVQLEFWVMVCLSYRKSTYPRGWTFGL